MKSNTSISIWFVVLCSAFTMMSGQKNNSIWNCLFPARIPVHNPYALLDTSPSTDSASSTEHKETKSQNNSKALRTTATLSSQKTVQATNTTSKMNDDDELAPEKKRVPRRFTFSREDIARSRQRERNRLFQDYRQQNIERFCTILRHNKQLNAQKYE